MPPSGPKPDHLQKTGDDSHMYWGKQPVPELSVPRRISEICFGLLNPGEVLRTSEANICSQELFRLPSRLPASHGCLDRRLGVSDKHSVCTTCQKKISECAGHYGHILLELPVFHIGYFKHTLALLQCICKTCSRVLLPQALRITFLHKMRAAWADSLRRASIFKKIADKCKKATRCPHCGAANSTVKRVVGAPTLKITHERFKGRAADEEVKQLREKMPDAIRSNPELEQHLVKSREDLSPLRVLELFRRITDEDCELLWVSATSSRPENMLLQVLPVPPVPIRPSVAVDGGGGGSNEDDLTIKLQEVIDVNIALKMALSGAPMRMVVEDWDFLQTQVAQYINGEMPGLPKPIGASRPIRGICQRLKGKTGRFRGNLSGKRVDFSARTVISPDPNLRIDQVGVPEHVAMIMTYPQQVNDINIAQMRALVRNGAGVWPGANYISHPDRKKDEQKESLSFGDNSKKAQRLKVGDIVERHMMDGDVVLFNRQPSLHKMSIMAHHAKVMQWRTFRFNECVCSPYNADFDGDEMNMHLPQTEEARAEADQLMGVAHNLVTPRNGEPLVAATQDFLTAAYLLTQRDVFFDRESFCRVVAYLGDAGEHIDVPVAAILKPVQLWTGKQVVSLLVRPNKVSPLRVDLEMKEKNYTSDAYFCPNDGYVCFHDGELVSGNLAKKTLGDGSKTGLFYTLIRQHGSPAAARCMNRLAKVCARFLGGHRGFSIGIDDVTPSAELSRLKADLIGRGYEAAEREIGLYERNSLSLQAGCNAIQSLESGLNGLLGEIRQTAGQEAMRALPWGNSPRIMAECGSKGSPLNISQMIACVGQQSVGGKRIEDGFVNRTLPHFPTKSLFPAAKGFVANSFYSGLTATEFFFHTMGGREGLVDTAVKTAETGYMARRLMKALEDLSMQYDGTVRNSEQTIIQFVYGDDGLNPALMETGVKVHIPSANDAVEVARPVELGKLLHHIVTVRPDPAGRPLSPAEIRRLAESTLGSLAFKALLPHAIKWHAEVKAFCGGLADRLQALEEVVGLCVPVDDDGDGRGGSGGGGHIVIDSGCGSGGGSASGGSGGGGSSGGSSNVGGGSSNGGRGGGCRESGSSGGRLAGRRGGRNGRGGRGAGRGGAMNGGGVAPAVGTAQWRKKRLGDSSTSPLAAAWRDAAAKEGSIEKLEEAALIARNTMGVTKAQLTEMFRSTLERYHRALVEPGEAVGAIGAQSISEPGTQMTLKTFHFAGVASMNVTLGVPRLKEIINGSKSISTPIITAKLVRDDCKAAARAVQARIEKTTLGQVSKHIEQLYKCDECYVDILLDMEAIRRLHLSVTAYSVKESILHGRYDESRPAVLKWLDSGGTSGAKGDVIVTNESRVRVKPPKARGSALRGNDRDIRGRKYFIMQALKAALPNVIVAGIPSVARAVINVQEGPSVVPGDGERYHLLVEGCGLRDVMGAPGIDGTRTKSNHIIEVEKTLGVEAARIMITEEISYIMKAYGITIDRRHLLLLSDVMTFKGEVLGITRFGVGKMRESVLMLASFEKTTDHLFDAAVHARTDRIVGVSECIIMGVPIPLGTGLFKLLSAAERPLVPAKPALTLSERSV